MARVGRPAPVGYPTVTLRRVDGDVGRPILQIEHRRRSLFRGSAGAEVPSRRVNPPLAATLSTAIYGTGDKNLPVATTAFMAKSAGARKVVGLKGASHLLLISHPKETAKVILEAAQQTLVSSFQGS